MAWAFQKNCKYDQGQLTTRHLYVVMNLLTNIAIIPEVLCIVFTIWQAGIHETIMSSCCPDKLHVIITESIWWNDPPIFSVEEINNFTCILGVPCPPAELCCCRRKWNDWYSIQSGIGVISKHDQTTWRCLSYWLNVKFNWI